MSDSINILLDELPKSVTIGDEDYSISSNFRTFVLFEMLLMDENLSDDDKLEEIVNLVFDGEPPPKITEEVINTIIDFYKCGRVIRKPKTKATQEKNKNKRVYDFSVDDGYIYSAFLSEYHIDLNEIDYLHWWKFRSLFEGLPSDCEFVKIMGYRGTDVSAIKDKNERSRILKMQALYALPDHLTVEEKAAKFGAIFGGG